MLKSVDFAQFMTSEGTKKLIFAFTSKTGQSVAHNRHRIFLFGFFCERMDIFRHFIRLISNSRVQGYSRCVKITAIDRVDTRYMYIFLMTVLEIFFFISVEYI